MLKALFPPKSIALLKLVAANKDLVNLLEVKTNGYIFFAGTQKYDPHQRSKTSEVTLPDLVKTGRDLKLRAG